MIQQQTILRVADNSGAKKVKCLDVLGGFGRKQAMLGDTITISVKELRNKYKKISKVFKGDVYKSIILRTKKKITKKDGSIQFFKNNSAILLSKQGKTLGTRILGPTPYTFNKISKIKSLGF